jgi:hypothetical protein
MIILFFLVLLVLFPGIEYGIAQTKDMVTLEFPPEVGIPIGETVELDISVIVKETFHLQANPVNDEFLIPTSVEIKPRKDIITEAPVYPPGKSFILKGTSDTLFVYDGRFSIRLPIQIIPAAQTGEYALEGELHYQACDSLKCFAPRSISFTIPVKAVKE